ncbi:MAG TPA: CPBP family intramembrane glutamic endopeptidase [Clostridia bacterium]
MINIQNNEINPNAKALFRNNFNLASIGFLTTAAGLIIVRIMFGLGWFSKLPQPAYETLGSILIQVVIILGGALLALLLQQKYNNNWLNQEPVSLKSRLRDMGFRMPRKYLIPLSFFLGILFIIMNAGVAFVNNLILYLLGYNFSAPSAEAAGGIGLFLLAMFNTAVLPGVCEEFLNRGIILRGLRDTMRDRTAIIVSALFFGLMHANIEQTLYTFVGGIILALLTVKTRSIYPAMIIHFVNNGVNVYLQHASANGWIGAGFEELLVENFLLAAALWVVAMIILFYILNYIIKAEDKYYAIKGGDDKQETLTPYQTPFGLFFIRTAPLYRPKFEEKIMMYTSIFLLTLTTILSFYWGTF